MRLMQINRCERFLSWSWTAIQPNCYHDQAPDCHFDAMYVLVILWVETSVNVSKNYDLC
jgi:hypothetical protein